MPTPTAFFEGKFVPLADANINIMTHAFNYGTAVFEGVRGNWNEEQGVVRIGHVKSATGIRAPLNIVIRGEGAGNAELSIASSDPPELKATLGEPKRLKDTLVHVPLVIEIPPGTPPMARLDTQQNDEARIVLKTNQPDVPEMIIPVRFAVER